MFRSVLGAPFSCPNSPHTLIELAVAIEEWHGAKRTTSRVKINRRPSFKINVHSHSSAASVNHTEWTAVVSALRGFACLCECPTTPRLTPFDGYYTPPYFPRYNNPSPSKDTRRKTDKRRDYSGPCYTSHIPAFRNTSRDPPSSEGSGTVRRCPGIRAQGPPYPSGSIV